MRGVSLLFAALLPWHLSADTRVKRSLADPEIIEAANVCMPGCVIIGGRQRCAADTTPQLVPLLLRALPPFVFVFVFRTLRKKFALQELKQLSDSGIYETLELEAIKQAETQVGSTGFHRLPQASTGFHRVTHFVGRMW